MCFHSRDVVKNDSTIILKVKKEGWSRFIFRNISANRLNPATLQYFLYPFWLIFIISTYRSFTVQEV